MGLMDKYNKGGVTFDIDITGFTYASLEDLYNIDNGNTIFGIDGLYINKKSSFGNHPVAIIACDNMLVDFPSYMTDDIIEMLKDPEVVEAIKAGKVGFTVQSYVQKQYKKTCYGVHWEDI